MKKETLASPDSNRHFIFLGGFMYRKIDDFLTDFESLSKSTIKVFEKMTDQNLAAAVTEGHRTLGQIAWHLVTTIPEMMSRTGLAFSSVNHEEPPPATAAEIIDSYKKVAVELLTQIKANWNDQTLGKFDDMYGQQWPRMQTTKILIHHELHHRGQMTVLLRQAGTTVPGTAGPSKEEWVNYGMQPPAY